ncbi:Conserved_hypothetical protein [Hexamita inflata]|uniref:Uncharacterized protein n=1 Tax=Hexamita inflata TaxID=28002 RepID=A0AA86NGE1_9EUKA|nr:Conserved hypothetical protein [Hexamita inflata]CAI9918630.1 Conserved hypothetical protein [Hexamita inflata]
MIYICNVYAAQSFKQCFSPASTIVGNRLTRTMTLNLYPNPLIKFIPSDNMCQVLDGKLSSASILLSSPTFGNIALPSSGGIQFTYKFNKNISIVYSFPTLADYDKTLDATHAGYNLLLDNDIQVSGSVADVFHTRSNQTSCFSSIRFTYSLPDSWFAFEVQPVFCSVSSFDVFFEYQVQGVWRRVPVHPVENTNTFLRSGDYSATNSNFLNIKRYLLDAESITERGKYSNSDRTQALNMINTLMSDSTIPMRLSLDYRVQTVTASITAVAEYTFSDNALKCHDTMLTRSGINENGLIYKTGFMTMMPCLEIPNTDSRYAFAQTIKRNTASIFTKVLIRNGSLVYSYNLTTNIVEFSQIPIVMYKVSPQDTRTLIDSEATENLKIQFFAEFLDVNGKRIFDLNTVPIDMTRTCSDKRILHIKDDSNTVVAWIKNTVPRCQAKKVVNATMRYMAIIFEDGRYKVNELYQLVNMNNYSLPIIPITYTCEHSLLDKQTCEAVRENNMKTTVRQNVKYYMESVSEFSELHFVVFDSSRGVWAVSYIVFGAIGAVVVGATVLLFIQRSRE